jgi:hypothetical protein
VNVFRHTSVLVPFVIMVTAESLLFMVLCRQSNKTRYRGFEVFATVSLASSIVCLGTATLMSTWEYFFAYYAAQLFKACALAGALYEQFAILFLPRWIMPTRGFRAFVLLLITIVAALTTCAAFAPQRTTFAVLALARSFVGWQNAIGFSVLCLILLFADHYGCYLRPHCRAIVIGLAWVTGIGIAESVVLALSASRAIPSLLGFGTTIVFTAVLLYWSRQFALRQEVHLLLTKEDTAQILHSVFLKKSPTSCGLTAGYRRGRIPLSGEEKANRCINL